MANQQQLFNLMNLFRGGATGNRTSFQNEQESPMFANKFTQGKVITPPGAARLPIHGPIPPARPGGGGGGSSTVLPTVGPVPLSRPYRQDMPNPPGTVPGDTYAGGDRMPPPLPYGHPAFPHSMTPNLIPGQDTFGTPSAGVSSGAMMNGGGGGGGGGGAPGGGTFADTVRGFERSIGQPAPNNPGVPGADPNMQQPNPAAAQQQPGGLMGLLLRAWHGAL